MKNGFQKAFHHGLESDFRVYSTFDIDDDGDGCCFCCRVRKIFRRTMSSEDEVKLTDFHIKEGIADRRNYFKENVFISMINYYRVIFNDGDRNRDRR